MAEQATSQSITPPGSSTLAQRMQEMHEQHRLVRQARFRNLLLWAVLISILFHIGLMIYLHFIDRDRGAPQIQEFQVSIGALLPDEELTALAETDLETPTEEALASLDALLDERNRSELTADNSAAQLQITGVGSTPTLGGAGSKGSVKGLGGSGAAGSFFGITTSGRRFAYIVDMSGSMEGRRMDTAKTELRRSIRALPDFAKFYVVFYSDRLAEPPSQEGWNLARAPVIRRISNWIQGLYAKGNTIPLPAFRRVFSLKERPDVIYFLTDGEITNMTARQVAALNNRGLRTVINTIAFGDASSQALLKQIALDSGGVYRFVESGRRP